MEAAFGFGFAVLFILFPLIAVAAIVVWIWTIVDVVKVPSDDRFRAGNQLVWILVIVLTGILGSIIYLAAGRPPAHLRR